MIRQLGLNTILIAFSLSMVALATLCLGIAGVELLQRLADDRALAQVRWGSLGAVEAVERTAERLVAAAQLLSERPTVARLYAGEERGSLQSYLQAYQKQGWFTECAILSENDLITIEQAQIPWDDWATSVKPDHDWQIWQATPSGPLVMIASAPFPGQGAPRVLVARLLDEAYAARTGLKVGLPVTIIANEDVDREGLDPRGLLRRRALEGEPATMARVGDPAHYLAARPLCDPGGRQVAVVETALPAAVVDASLGRLSKMLIGLMLGVGLLVALLSSWLSGRIARPIEDLTQAAQRIGRGDLSSPIPLSSGLETGTLSNAMEEMREKILRLASDLKRKRAEAEAVLTGIVEGVFSVDRERRIRYLNPQAAELLGVDSHQVEGCFCGDILRPRETGGTRPCEHSCPILHARFRGNARATEHLELRDGTTLSVVITSAPVTSSPEDAAAQDALQFQVMRDETDDEATRRLRDTVLADISHEFRTPLSAQLASLELLRDKLSEVDSPEIQDLVMSTERGTVRLVQLVDNLLESTRIEAGRDSLRRSRLELDQVVEEAVELIAPLVAQRRQTLSIGLPYPMPAVMGDQPRLVQVFVNLLANANKFAPLDSLISVGGRVEPNEIRLWVDDQGPGLPAGAEDTIFQRFARSVDLEPEVKGLGLGLYR